MRGHTVTSCAELSQCMLFQENFITHVDVTLILGLFDREAATCSPKVLCLHFHALQSSISNTDATTLLSIIGSSSGKHGFELARTCGSSGMTCAQSDRDLLRALHDCRTSLPRKLGAIKITRHSKFSYKITYRRVLDPPDDNVVSFKYYVPRRGGLFEMRPGLVSKYPLFADFPYVKMIAVNMLDAIN